MLKKIKKSEKGSITILVLTTMLVVVGVILFAYMLMMNKSSSQEKELGKIQEEYNQTDDMMSQAYDEYNNGNQTDEPEPEPDPSLLLKEGDYVYFEDADGIQRICMVLWDKNSGYGTQIITLDIVQSVALGSYDSYEKSLNSYNNAINTLNTYVEYYAEETYATDARCVGSNPSNKNAEGSLDNVIRNPDENYTKDYEQMNKLGVTTISGEGYWLASRVTGTNVTNDYLFGVRYISTSGELNSAYLFDNTQSYNDYTSNLRPVFTLREDIKIISGSGTEDDPYTLGI